MSFKELSIESEYRSGENDIIREFYLPLLYEAKEYKRAVGFFSSTSLVELSKGITQLIKNIWVMQQNLQL